MVCDVNARGYLPELMLCVVSAQGYTSESWCVWCVHEDFPLN